MNHHRHLKEEESRRHQARLKNDGLAKLAVAIQIWKATEVVPFAARVEAMVRVPSILLFYVFALFVRIQDHSQWMISFKHEECKTAVASGCLEMEFFDPVIE